MEQNFVHLTPQQTLEQLNVTSDGLNSAEASQRLAQYGPNQLAEGKRKSVAAVFFEQFKDLLVVILIVAALISMFSGNMESTLVIFRRAASSTPFWAPYSISRLKSLWKA